MNDQTEYQQNGLVLLENHLLSQPIGENFFIEILIEEHEKKTLFCCCC